MKTFPALEPNPGISYIMPVLNEAEYLETAVASIYMQKYGGEREIILALGTSSDDTDVIAKRLAAHDSQLKLVQNPKNDVSIGLNLAIKASRYPVIIRVDAHSELPENYAAVMVEKLSTTGAANVGGVMLAKGATPMQKAIARTYNSPFGMGGGSYHGGSVAGSAMSAYLGSFRREVFDEVGLFDEKLRRAQDWELNFRIRQAGYLVWFTPEIEVGYWPRASLEKFRKQMYATGVWRGHIARRGQRGWKHFAPPLLVLGLLTSLVLILIGQSRANPKLSAVGVALPAAYIGGLKLATIKMGFSGFQGFIYDIICMFVVHLSWGTGFIKGYLFGAEDTFDQSRVGRT